MKHSPVKNPEQVREFLVPLIGHPGVPLNAVAPIGNIIALDAQLLETTAAA